MSYHTPGPWDYDAETGDVLATKCGYHPGGGPAFICHAEELEGEQYANGVLIACAPDMLRELDNVIAQAEANPFLSVGMLLEHHSRIREVAAKAHGLDIAARARACGAV